MSDFDTRTGQQEETEAAPTTGARGVVAAELPLLEALLNGATSAMFLLDERQHCVYMNPAGERLTGYRLGEVTGRPLHEFVHHTRPDRTPYPMEECPIDRAFVENRRMQGEETFVHKDGRFYPVSFTASPVRGPGAITGTIIEVIDISEKKRTEAALEVLTAESERQRRLYETIISNTPDLVYVFDTDCRFTFANRALLDTWGRTLEESVGKSMRELDYEPWHAELHEKELAQVVATKRPVRGEVPFRHAALGQRTYDYIFVPVLNDEGEVEAIAGTTRDVTDYKQTEEALREAHLLLDAAVSAGGVVAWVWDVQSDRMRGNEEFARLFSTDPAGAAKGLPLSVFLEAILEEDREPVMKAVERAMETGEPYSADYRVRASDGQVRWVSVRGRVEYDESGKPSKFAGVLVDITSRKEAEAERESLIEALGRIRNELEQHVEERTSELKELNQELESFNYSVSHDLRAPLRSIDGFSDVLLQDYGESLDATARSYLYRIRHGAQRMGRLIDDLLTLSHLSKGSLRRQPLELSGMAASVLQALREADPGRHVAVEIEEGLTGHGDEGFVRILLENLLGNAWKFTRKQDRAVIAFASSTIDGERVFEVRDNGVGFDMQYSSKLFAPFQRLHSPGDFEGTGIGLAIVERIVRRHGGRLWAEAEPGKGASFFFTLP